MCARNTLVQLLAAYTNPESECTALQTDRQTDRRTDGQQDYANSRSYCVAVRSAKNVFFIFLNFFYIYSYSKLKAHKCNYVKCMKTLTIQYLYCNNTAYQLNSHQNIPGITLFTTRTSRYHFLSISVDDNKIHMVVF